MIAPGTQSNVASTRGLRIALVAGEASGDLLGAGLIHALRETLPDARFEGVAGPRMRDAGCQPLDDAERLSAFGLIDVLRHLPTGLAMRRRLATRWLDDPPDLFVGIDAPTFNLALEARLRHAGIPVVHYVSPTVWAWRRYRLRRMRRSIDLLLTLFPYEAAFCEQAGLPARFIGHPLADAITRHPDRAAARRALGLDGEGELVALLPGSRGGEITHLGGRFLDAAAWLLARRPGLRFVLPAATPRLRARLETLVAAHAGLPLILTDGRAQEAMTASDVVLVASGTAALETLLVGRPMVVAYRLSPLAHALMRPFVHLRHFSPPNLLAGREVVPERIQNDASPERLGTDLLRLLEHAELREAQCEAFAAIGDELRRDASRTAAEAVVALLRQHEGAGT